MMEAAITGSNIRPVYKRERVSSRMLRPLSTPSQVKLSSLGNSIHLAGRSVGE